MGFPEKLLSCGGYNIELEMNSLKKRVSIYIQKNDNFIRRLDLEKEDYHIVIIDVKTEISLRIISLYRSFRSQGGISPEAFFIAQNLCSVLKGAMTRNCFVLGDFNLDVEMEHITDYLYKGPLSQLTDFTTQNNLVQLVHFKT